MRRRNNDLARLLDGQDLPAAVREIVGSAVSRSGLPAAERIEVARELIAHFEDGMARGRSVEDLLAEFGDGRVAGQLIRQAKRAGRRSRVLEERMGRSGDAIVWVVARDLRYAMRRLLLSPAFTLTAILSLALGIGANAAIFTVVNELLLEQLPVPRADELVEIYESSTEFPHNVFSYPDYVDFAERTTDRFAVLAGSSITFGSTDTDGAVETMIVEAVSGTYFPLLELPASVGRLLGPDDDVTPGAHPVVVLDHGYWQRRYGADPQILGRQLTISGASYTIVGVAPERHRGLIRGIRPSAYVSIQMKDSVQGNAGSALEARGNHSFFARGRLASGVSLEQARQAAESVAVDMRRLYPDEWRPDNAFLLVPTADIVLFPAFDGALTAGAWLLLAVVGMVLLIACANLAGFLLARAVDRRKEISVRLALGATRGKLIAQLVSETVLLALIGGAAGLGLAWWMLRALAAAEIPFPVPIVFDFAIDLRVFLFTAAISLVAGLLFGLAPALQATGYEVASTLRDEAAGAGRGGRLRLRNALVVGQVAISVVLLVTAGLLVRTVQSVQSVDPGFGREPTAIVSFALPAATYGPDAHALMVAELLDDMAGLPSVDKLGLISNLHLNQANTQWFSVAVEGVAPPPGRDFHSIDWAAADPGLFEAAGIEIQEGRNFDSSDDAAGRRVAIVSRAFAQRFFAQGQAALGGAFTDPDGHEYQIVGIASDTKVRTIGEDARPFLYRPYAQANSQSVTLLARTLGDPQATAEAMVRTIRARAPEALLYEAKTMAAHLDVVRFPARLAALTVSGFALLALLLAAIGLFGLVSYAQAQRSREVGIRMALGARSGSVVAMLLRGGLSLVVLGGAIGLLSAMAVSRLLGNLLFGIQPTDPVAFVVMPLVLLVTSLVAAWVPARRASRVDPVVALRTE